MQVAAGNEDIDLDYLDQHNFTYSPCLVKLPNVLCVGATDANDKTVSHLLSPLAFLSTPGSAHHSQPPILVLRRAAGPLVSPILILGPTMEQQRSTSERPGSPSIAPGSRMSRWVHSGCTA
jgi:hypothetical protein